MSLAWMLTFRSLRQSKSRLALITGAVAFGVCMILVFAAFFNAFGSTTSTRWLRAIDDAIDSAPQLHHVQSDKADAANSVLVKRVDNPFLIVDGKQIHGLYVDISATEHAPDLFGITWPNHGEFLMSQGVQDLIDSHPEVAIAPRFGSASKGLLPYQLTTGPDDLLVFIGTSLSDNDMAVSVADFNASMPLMRNGAVNQAILLIGLVVLLFPVLLLVAISAALGSVQREQRYAALRLVGATRRQIVQILIVESMLGALLGFMLGLVVFTAIHPLLGSISLAGRRLWLADLTVASWQYAATLVATVVMTGLATSQGMRAVTTTPLGVVRRHRVMRQPSAVRIVVIAVAIGLAIYLSVGVKPNQGTSKDAYLLLTDVVLMMVGLIVVSPWVIRLFAQGIAKHSARAPELIGTRYVAAHSRQISRSVSGVILALFAGTFFLTAISQTGDAINAVTRGHTPLQRSAVVLSDIPERSAAIQLAAQLQTKPYVAQAEAVPFVAGAWNLVPCVNAANYVTTSCNSGVLGVNVWAPTGEADQLIQAKNREDFSEIVGRDYAADTTHETYSVLVSLKDTHAIEHLRTFLATADFMPAFAVPLVSVGSEADAPTDTGFISFMTALVWAGMGLTLLIAVISMLVSTYANLLERRRSLLTLRLSGMKVSELVRMMLMESIAPLALIALVSTGFGFSVGWVMMHMFSVTLDASFTPAIVGALAAALALAGLAMLLLAPAVRKVSEPASNRSE